MNTIYVCIYILYIYIYQDFFDLTFPRGVIILDTSISPLFQVAQW